MGETWGKGTILFHMVKTARARGGRTARMPKGRKTTACQYHPKRTGVGFQHMCYINRVALTLYASQSLRNWGRYIKYK